MPLLPADMMPLIGYAAPPLVGAFIGYMTNKIAIRMLFRPLRQWRVGPFRVPMTPGVIPAQRHQLAYNIGEMVGEHLLTGEEINVALQRSEFQEHLYALIEAKAGSLFKQDLGTLGSLIPNGYRSYFDIAAKTLLYRMKDAISQYLQSDRAEQVVRGTIDAWIDSLLAERIDALVGVAERRAVYATLERQLQALLDGGELETWLRDLVHREIETIVAERKTLANLLPEALQRLIVDTVREQTPFVLERIGDLIRDEAMREKLIAVICKAIGEFILTLGPMAGMVKSFVKMDQLEEKIRAFLDDKEDDIVAALHSDDLRHRIATALGERTEELLHKPIGDLLGGVETERLTGLSGQAVNRILAWLRTTPFAHQLSAIIADKLEDFLEHGERRSGSLVERLIGDDGVHRFRLWIKEAAVAGVRSSQNKQTIERMIDELFAGLLARPVGRLDHLIPAGVRDGLYRSLQRLATTILVSEVPGVVKSININRIVTDRIDSFDLLRVERLLLSIMQEQFKYINLFGALLGFLIGCVNIVFLYFR
jgi:uncharacterized membrane protein YheB (UPF0754 family)